MWPLGSQKYIPPAVPVVSLHIFAGPGPAPILEAGTLHGSVDRIELLVANVERIVMPFEALAVVEIQRERVIHFNAAGA